jgi:protein-S-isoprenylcysteine O-methyltransferase Ste14
MLRAKRRETLGTYDDWKELNEYTAAKGMAATPSISGKSLRRVMETLLNLGGAAIYVVSAAALVIDYRNSDRVSSLLMLVLMTLFAFFFIARTTPPRESNTSVRDWLVAIAGTSMPMLMRPAVTVNDIVVTEAMQFVGLCISITGLLALNNSFGMVACNRGVKTGGIYKYIRHPIYAGYFVAWAGFLIQNFTLQNMLVMAAWVTLEFGRMHAEERFLSRDPAYAAYMKRTRWRIIPYVI